MQASLFLFFYSICKAFLPLPSLEAVLLPLCLKYPEKAFVYALISGCGTSIGGWIGYELSFRYGRKFALKWVSQTTLAEGEKQFNTIGIWAVIVGSITPFPDFILAYIAGIVGMNRWLFLILDGSCRFVRSLLMIFALKQVSSFFHLDRYMTIFSIMILVYFIGKYLIKKER